MSTVQYGRVFGEAEQVYRNSGCIGSSEVSLFHRSEALWAGLKAGKWQRNEERPALGFGQLFHAMVLQPEIVPATFAVMPKADGRTKEGKALKEAFNAANVGRKVVTQDDWQLGQEMTAAVRQNELATDYLCGDHEVTYRYFDKALGLGVQCRTDTIDERAPWISDLKSTESLGKFVRTLYDYGYHRQAALYRATVSKVLDIPESSIPFVFVAVEKNPPYAVGVYVLDQDYLDAGAREVRSALTRMAAVMHGDKPRRDPVGVQTLSCPKFIRASKPSEPEVAFAMEDF